MTRAVLLQVELEAVGADEFCRRRYEREDMPVRLMKALAKAPVVDEASLQRLASLSATMTPRRLEVLDCMSRGLFDKQIAAELSLSIFTVKTHIKKVMAILGAVNRAHAVRIASEQGLLGNGSRPAD